MVALITNQEFQNSPYGALADNLDNLASVIARASAAIETMASRPFGVSTYTEVVRPTIYATSESTTIFTKHRPIVAVTQIRHRRNALYGWDIVDPSLYVVENGPGYISSYTSQWFLVNPIGQSYPLWSINQLGGWEVEVTYTSGLATIPDDIKQAVLYQTVLYAYQDTQIYARTDDKTPGILYFKEFIEDVVKRYRQTGTVYQSSKP